VPKYFYFYLGLCHLWIK